MDTPAPERKPPKPSRTELAFGRLKAMILSGQLPPGEQVDASRLASELGLGRTPVREALQRLEAQGIVRILPKRGVRIVSLSANDLTEIYQVISAVEVERMMAAAEAGDGEAWALADEDFHRGLLDLSPNRRLCDVGIAHRDLAQRAHFVALRLLTAEQRLHSAEQHRDLVRLIAAGDGEAVATRHRNQRDRGAHMLVDILRDPSSFLSLDRRRRARSGGHRRRPALTGGLFFRYHCRQRHRVGRSGCPARRRNPDNG